MQKKIILSIIFFMVVCSNARADNFFFVTFEYPPLSYENSHGQSDGIFVRMVTQIMHNTGHEVKIEVLPWTRALSMVRQGKADAIFTAYKNPERETYLDYSKQVLFPQEVFFYKKNTDTFIFNGKIETLSGKRIGVVSTISYGTKFDFFKPNLNIEKANKLEHNFIKLYHGRIDLVPSHSYVADLLLRQLGLTGKIIKTKEKLDVIPSYIAFSKKRELNELILRFDNELLKMKQSGKYTEILKSYHVLSE